MSTKRVLLILLAVFALIAAACGDDDGGGGAVETTSAAEEGDDGLEGEDDTGAEEGGDLGGDDEGEDDSGDDGLGGDDEADDLGGGDDGANEACDGVTLEATDTGVTEDTITVFVMADIGSELAPGLFQGSIDGARAWVDKVNDNGGLGCRDVELVEWDSAINPTETTNGFLNACDTSLAMVGSTSLFATDITPIEDCGIADIPERAVADAHHCSPNVFMVAPANGSCPYSGEGPRDFNINQGAYEWILENELAGGPVKGAYVIPSDLPTTINATMPSIVGVNEIGVDTTGGGEFGVSGTAEQASFGAIVQYMANNGVTWAQSGSNDQSMLKWRNEAAAQNFDDTGVAWVCSIACYTPELLEQGGDNVEGTLVWMPFLPYGESDTNDELATFLEYVGTDFPPSWAASAWASGLVLEQVIDEIMATDGPNGITRQAILDRLANVGAFDANGWFGEVNVGARQGSPCFVVLLVEGGEFVRRHPEEAGTLDCDAQAFEITGLDPAARYQG